MEPRSNNPSETSGSLRVIEGPDAGVVVRVGERLTLGRRSENDLCLQDERISRFHAVIEKRQDRYVITDLGSRTGTHLNGAPLNAPTPLNPGSQVTLGHTVLEFQLGDQKPILPRSKLEVPSIPRLSERRETRPRMEAPPRFSLVPVDEDSISQSFERNDVAELKRAGRHLQTLLAANAIISTELDLERLFEKILDALFDTFPAHRAVIMTEDKNSEELIVRAHRTAKPSHDESEALASQTIARRAFRERVGILTLDAGSDDRFDQGVSIADLNIRSVICAPMTHHEDVLGVIYLDTVGTSHAFREDDLKLLTAIAGPAGGAVRNAVLVSKLKSTAVDTIFRLAIAAEYRDDETGFHIHRMSDYTAAIARKLGKDESYCDLIKLASPMHDVGKIGIPDAILKKPGRLTPEEFQIMKGHPAKGAAVLAGSNNELIQMAHQIALTHHEKFDGSGYPKGLKGEDIPLEGRIVAVADVFDALTSERCYKPAFSIEKSFGILREGRGRHFDPTVLDAFFAIEQEVLGIRSYYQGLEEEAKAKGEDATAASLLLRRAPSRSRSTG